MPRKTEQSSTDFTHPTLDEGIEMLEKASRLTFRIFENSAGFLLNNTAGRLRLEMLRSFKFRGYTITPDQWVVLNAVAEHEGICQRDLAGKTLKDRPTVTRILDILEANRPDIYSSSYALSCPTVSLLVEITFRRRSSTEFSEPRAIFESNLYSG